MKITKLKLVNFRNYDNEEFTFSKTRNFLIGNNGSGKTNIVEAIYYLALTKSFRTNNDLSLIKENKDSFCIEAKIKSKLTDTYKIVLSNKTKKISINNTNINKIGDYISKINVILFNPEDLKLVKDNPAIHRKLINMELSTFDNNYLRYLSIYNKILKQRNVYLKEMFLNSMLSKEYLNIITDKLIDYGMKIYEIRNNYINNLNEYLTNIFFNITGRSALKLIYVSQFNNKSKENIEKIYQKNLQKDLNYGKTNYGIHLDDFLFDFNNKNIKEYLSEGEQKNAIVAMKLSEIEYCLNKINSEPILILDDLFSELDKNKINNIINYLRDDIQIFITTTDIHKVNKSLVNNCNIYKIKEGKIKVINYE